MQPNNMIVNAKGAFCLEKPGEIYVVYLLVGTQNAKVSLSGGKSFSVKWFNPREGGEMMEGSAASVQGKGFQIIGNPPAELDKDWVVVVR